MSNKMTINFNNENYIAKYNEQTGYYEIDLTAPLVGGVYHANIKFTDLLGQTYEETEAIQVFAKEKIKIETNKVFMWIFDYKDFSVKDIVEISDYEINIDEETNANTIIKVLKKTTAKAKDIVAVKKNNEVVYWGVVDNIQNEDGKRLYEYTIKYITNMFNQNVPLYKNVEDDEIEEGYYRIKTVLDTKKVLDVANGSMDNGGNVQLWENNNTDAQKWKITKTEDGYYSIICLKSNLSLDVANADFSENVNIQQWTHHGGDAQKWKIERIDKAQYRIGTVVNNLYLTVTLGETDNGTNIKINSLQTVEQEKQIFMLEKLDDIEIRKTGVEDYIAEMIRDNFISTKDVFINKPYLQVEVKSHTPKQTSVTNVQDGIYNLHTWMTNCTQNYDVVYDFNVIDKKLVMTIEVKEIDKELIDTKAQAISNYSEVFETDVVSKVVVLTSTDTYTLYLLNDRTTTEDMTNENRAEGRVETVYTEKYEDAPQKALDTIKANRYNHNITFNLYNRLLKIGTPIAIKTRESLIFDTYISAVKITRNKFVEYTCGNIRIKFIDKLLKERNK